MGGRLRLTRVAISVCVVHLVWRIYLNEAYVRTTSNVEWLSKRSK